MRIGRDKEMVIKTEKEIEIQLSKAYDDLEVINKYVLPGSGIYSRRKSYIDALEWVLGRE